jgi:hypothetical protein
MLFCFAPQEEAANVRRMRQLLDSQFGAAEVEIFNDAYIRIPPLVVA